jgi:hypothetical protein
VVLQLSIVQASPSSQLIAVYWQPEEGMQLSVVQALLSSHTVEVFAHNPVVGLQAVALQWSPVGQTNSAQAALQPTILTY